MFFNDHFPKYNYEKQDINNRFKDKRAINTFEYYGLNFDDIFGIRNSKYNGVCIESFVALNNKVNSKVCSEFNLEDFRLFSDVISFVCEKYLYRTLTKSTLDEMNQEVVYMLKEVGF